MTKAKSIIKIYPKMVGTKKLNTKIAIKNNARIYTSFIKKSDFFKVKVKFGMVFISTFFVKALTV